MGTKHENRSEDARARQSAEKSAHNTLRWLKTCPVFISRDVTRASLEARTKNSADEKKKAEETMETMKIWEADAFSLVMVSAKGEVLFAYCAYSSPPQNAHPRWPTFAEFLDGDVDLDSLPEYPGPHGRTDKDVRKGMQHDGLQVSVIQAASVDSLTSLPQEANLHRTHVAMQNLCHYLPPVASNRDKRHPEDNMMAYPSGDGVQHIEHEGVEREGVQHCQQNYERAGVHHLVHGWPMQGHPVCPTSTHRLRRFNLPYRTVTSIRRGTCRVRR